jgi:hypothetical protein
MIQTETANLMMMEDQEAGCKPCIPSRGYYTIDLTNKSVDNVDFGSARVFETSDTRVSKTCDGKGVRLIQVGEETCPIMYGWWDEEKAAAALAAVEYIPSH